MPWLKPPTRDSARSRRPDDLEHLVDALLAHGPGHAAQQAQVAARRHERVEGGVVDEAAHVPQRVLALARARGGRRPRRARSSGWMRPEHQADDRGLAGAVRPQKAEHVAAGRPHVEAVDGAEAPNSLVRPWVARMGARPSQSRRSGRAPSRSSASAPPRRRASRHRPRQRTDLTNAWRSAAGTSPAATTVVSSLLPDDGAAERRRDDARLAAVRRSDAHQTAGSCCSCCRVCAVVLVCTSTMRAQALAVDQHGGRARPRAASAAPCRRCAAHHAAAVRSSGDAERRQRHALARGRRPSGTAAPCSRAACASSKGTSFCACACVRRALHAPLQAFAPRRELALRSAATRSCSWLASTVLRRRPWRPPAA